MSLPKPNIIDPAAVPALRWGVLGAAKIAHAWVDSVQKHTKQQVIAVASRTPGKAEPFASKFAIDSHDSYEELLARDDIDAVYIPTLPNQHKDHALLALAAGKHVLIEKPVTLSPEEAAEIFAFAKSKGLLAMEAMWTRYLPKFDIAKQLIAADEVGEIEVVSAQFGFDLRHVPRLWNLGEGSPIFDIGIYAVSFAQFFLGNPIKIEATGRVSAVGIDEECSVVLHYASGARAYLLISGVAAIPVHGSASGSKKYLDMGDPFFTPSSISLREKSDYPTGPTWIDETGVVGHEGLSYQATAFAKYVSDGLLESPLESHADSLANLEVCNEIIRQLGAKVY